MPRTKRVNKKSFSARPQSKPQTKKPSLGTRTQAQTGGLFAQNSSGSLTSSLIPQSLLTLPGFGKSPPATYQTWRQMRNDPSVNLAWAIATAPIRAAKWTYNTKSAPAGARDFIEEIMEPLKDWLTHNALYALQYGFSPMEKNFDMRDGKITLIGLKPLLPDITDILITRNGSFGGLRADKGKTELPPEKCFVFTNEIEAGDLYGKSRFECIRADWHSNKILREKQGQFLDKIASVLLILKYAPGTSLDRYGTEISNFEIAEKIIRDLRQGMAVAVPNDTLGGYEADDLLARGMDPKQLSAWQFDFLETNAQHGQDMVLQMKHKESLIFTGLLVPPRSATEGQYGTKAEAGAHADIALSLAELTLNDLVRHINWHVVNQLLVLNYGTSAENTVWIDPQPVESEKKELLKEIIRMTYAPQNADLTLSMIDMDKAFHELGLPKASETMVQGIVEANLNTPQPPQPNPVNPNEGQPAEPRTNQ